MYRLLGIFCVLFFLGMTVRAQVAPDCSNAVPVCNNTPVNGGTQGFGMDDFNGAFTTGCLEQSLDGTIESNSAWYRFRTGASGQLGFNIGISTEEDWDFALYKSDDCDDLGDPIRCNFFDNEDGNSFVGVGEDPTGRMDNIQYGDWLQVETGEDYYLFINNFSNNNSGFSVQFSGQIFVTHPNTALDCSIINNLLGPPISACENDAIVLDATTADATQYTWFSDIGAGFSPISGEHDATLDVDASATYRVEVVRPMETIISDVQVAFSALPVAHPVYDEASCSDLDVYDFSQKDGEVLGGQNLEEFVVSYHNSLADANNGVGALPRQYPTQTGSQTIFIRVGSIDNPRCFDSSQRFRLINLETPVLDFPEQVYLCQADSGIVIGPETSNPSYTYQWDSGETTPNIEVTTAGTHTLTVTNTQGSISCSATRTVSVIVSEPPRITDIEIHDLRNNNTVTVLTGSSTGLDSNTTAGPESDSASGSQSGSPTKLEYRLDDGPYQDGNVFYDVLPGAHTVTVNDPDGCGAVTEEIVVIGFPKFFTPNNDGSNDVWHISGLELLENPSVAIFDRYGKLLVKLDGSAYSWMGTFRGRLLPEADYWFRLTYTDPRGQTVEAKYIDNHFSLKR